MKDCIFCRIVLGEVPCYKVYEDKLFLGFLNIMPRTVGHSLVIPKKHYRWVYDIAEFGSYWEAILKLTNAMKRVFNTDWVTYFTYGALEHAHVHVIPRNRSVGASESEYDIIPQLVHLDKKEMGEIASKILREVENG